MEMLKTTPEQERRYRECGIWGDLTLVERFFQQADAAPDRLAIIDAKRSYSYRQFAKLVDNLASSFLGLGIRHGEVVGCQVPNWGELTLVQFACNRIGAICLPIHESWRELEVTNLLKQSGAVAVVAPLNFKDFDYPAMLAGLRNELPKLGKIFSIGGASPHSSAFEPLLADVTADAKALAARRPNPNEPAALMLSSGTTALPKISVFSSNNMYGLARPFLKAVRFVAGEMVAALAPIGTGGMGYIYPVLAPLLQGGTSVMLERWEPGAGVEVILKYRCAYGVAVPAQLTQMLPVLESHKPADFDGFRAMFNGGAPLPAEVARQVEDLMNCKVISCYGATDGGIVSSTDLDDPLEKRLGTVGRPYEEREVKLGDANGTPVGPGEPGEIYWRSADKSYGYMNDPEATNAVWTADRFYRSGDLGQFDADGYLMIIGRVKDMILRGGRNISPRLIEDVTIQHPAILEVAVASMPDPVLGERACAFAVLRKGAKLSFEELIAFLKEHLSGVGQAMVDGGPPADGTEKRVRP